MPAVSNTIADGMSTNIPSGEVSVAARPGSVTTRYKRERGHKQREQHDLRADAAGARTDLVGQASVEGQPITDACDHRRRTRRGQLLGGDQRKRLQRKGHAMVGSLARGFAQGLVERRIQLERAQRPLKWIDGAKWRPLQRNAESRREWKPGTQRRMRGLKHIERTRSSGHGLAALANARGQRCPKTGRRSPACCDGRRAHRQREACDGNAKCRGTERTHLRRLRSRAGRDPISGWLRA